MFGAMKRQLQERIEYLKALVAWQQGEIKLLQDRLWELQKPKPLAPPIMPSKPQVYDETKKRYREKTDEEIAQDIKSLQELNIL